MPYGAPLLSPKTIIIAQFFISLIMAFLMSGYATAVHSGLNAAWLGEWGLAFVMAWPVAFVLSIGVSRLGFAIACRITGEGRTA
jgi:hypothetical protein